jgi:hypothetical protein
MLVKIVLITIVIELLLCALTIPQMLQIFLPHELFWPFAAILDYDECNPAGDFHTDICGKNEKCVNTELSFECQCKEGFQNNGTACVGEFIGVSKWILV